MVPIIRETDLIRSKVDIFLLAQVAFVAFDFGLSLGINVVRRLLHASLVDVPDHHLSPTPSKVHRHQSTNSTPYNK